MAQKMSAINVKSQYAILERCTADLQECVREMQQEFQESQVHITDDDSVFHRFCAKLEFLLQHRLKEKSGLLSGKKTYWDYFCRCLVAHKTSARDGIKFVKSVSEFKTAAGKGRAFLRFCLVHQCLADTLQQCLSDVPATTEYYHPDAAVLHSQLAATIVSSLYDLSAVQFDLAPTGYDLDVAFPSFARKIYGTPPSWRASTPSRTLSMSSFSFSTPQSLSSSFPRDFMASSENGGDDTGASSGEPDMEQQVQQLQLELARVEGVKTSLCMSVSTLGEERQVLEDKVADLERVLAQVRKNAAEEKEGLETKVAELEDRLSAYQNEAPSSNNKTEALERMNAELSIRLTTTEAERDDLRARLQQTSEEHIKAFEAREKDLCDQVRSLKEEISTLQFQLSTQTLEYEQTAQAYKEHQDIFQVLEERVEKQNALVKELEQLLAEVKRERDIERTESAAKMETMRSLLATREEECQGLSQELKECSAELNELRVTNKKMDEELRAIRTEWSKKETDFQSEVTLLRDESVQLRHKIIKLIKEKDMLWQRTDRLLHLQRVQASDMWIPDHEVSCCLACRVTFTFLLRKHHCRLCGRIFCHRCADNWIMTAASNRRARVCNECFIVHRDIGCETSALAFSQDSDVGDGQEQQESSELLQSDSSPNSSSVSSPPTTSHMLCMEVGNMPETNEGTFAVLSDEEITRSLSESSPYAQSPLVRGQFEPGEVTCSLLRTVKEIEDCEGIGEAWVNAGMIYKVPIAVDVSGIVLHWEFRTEPKSLAFSVVYECTEDEEENRILVETTHVTSHLQSVEGSLTCQKPGTYCLLFDNSLSRYLAKKITYQLSVSKADESCKEETSDTG